MNTLHLRTRGFYCAACPQVVEQALAPIPGVMRVAIVRSMGLTSILFDPAIADAEDLCARIRRAGFGTEVYGVEGDQEGFEELQSQ